eukprot:SAG22_NODE_6217_length_884_cov_1.169427_1_plen_84_part_00
MDGWLAGWLAGWMDGPWPTAVCCLSCLVLSSDVTGRNLISKGLSYESFRQFSAFQSLKDLVGRTKAVGANAAACVTDKDCGNI